MRTNTRSLSAFTKRALVISVALAAISPSAHADNDAETATLNTLIVTGERSDRDLNDTYQGVSVITDDNPDLQEPTANLNNAVRKTPNAFVQGPSELPVIRGVQGGGAGGLNSAAITGAPSRLPLIVDGVTRIPSLVNRSYMSLWDVEQIEVLRGPQSLLRGRTGIAGALVVNTYDPTPYFESAVQAGAAFNDVNDPQYTLNAMMSGPLSDSVKARATLELADGHDPRKVINGDAPFITEYDQARLRSKVTGAMGRDSNWTLLLEHDEGQVPQTRNFVEDPALTGNPYKERTIRANANTRAFDSEASVVALKTSTNVGNNRFETITSWGRDRFESVEEQTFPSDLGADERLINFDAIYRFGPDSDVAASEVGGLFGIGFEDREQAFDATGVPILADIDVEAQTLAAYTDLRFGLTESLTLLAGARLQEFKDDRRIATTAFLPPPVGPQSGTTEGDENELILLPKFGLAWEATDRDTLAATIRRGFTPGGAAINAFSATPYEYNKETVWTTELSWRSQPTRSLRTGVILFYNDFTDPQVYGEVVPGNRLSLQVFNQDGGQSYGAEFDLEWQATQTLSVNGAIGLLNTEITEANSARPDLEGNEFGQDPSITGSVGVNWRAMPQLALDAQATYVGEAYNDFNNTPGTEIGDYTLANVGATWSLSKADLRLYVNNLFNETGLTGRVSGSGAFVTEPRETGLVATVYF